jgi:hypothetical protein
MTQGELAAAVAMPQPSVARIESGAVSPRTETLARLLRATGHELAVEPRLGVDVDPATLRDALEMEPHERVRRAVKRSGGRRDPIRILRRLRHFGVHFVLIGPLAETVHGADAGASVVVCHRRSQENQRRLDLALADLGPEARDLELVGAPSGTNGFADLDANARTVLVGVGVQVRVAALDDLIRIRRHGTGSDRGADALEVLGALRDALERGPDG